MSLVLAAALSGVVALPPYHALGQEPGWSLEVAQRPRRATLVTDYGKRRAVALMRPPVTRPDGTRLWVSTDRRLRVTIRSGGCADSMSGKRFMDTVTVALGGKVYRGCGGEPLDGIENTEWSVEDIGGRGIVDNSRVTIELRDGRIAGRATCNRYTAKATVKGDRITIGPPAATMMACPEALMEQERRFLDILGKAARWSIDGEGALVISAADGRTLSARRAS